MRARQQGHEYFFVCLQLIGQTLIFFLQDTVFSHICQWTMVQGKRELDDYVVIEGGRWGELLVQLEQLDGWSLSMWV